MVATLIPTREAGFLHNPDGVGQGAHCATVLAAASGHLHVVWYAYPKDEHVGASIVMATRTPGGAWAKARKIVGSTQSLGNPVLFEGPVGTLRLLFVNLRGGYWDRAELRQVCSTDGGRSWSNATPVMDEPGTMVRHRPVLRPDGSLLLPAYHEGRRETMMLVSRAPYDKWERGHVFSGFEIFQPDLVLEDGGDMSLLFRPATEPRKVWRSRSSDGGRRWSRPLRTTLNCPLSGIAAVSCQGRLVVVHNPNETQRHPLSLSWSQDGGCSVEGSAPLDEQNFELSYPNFTVDAEGLIQGVYTYRRMMIKRVTIDPAELWGPS